MLGGTLKVVGCHWAIKKGQYMLGGNLKEVGIKRAWKSVNTCWAALSKGWALTSVNTCWAALSKRWAVSSINCFKNQIFIVKQLVEDSYDSNSGNLAKSTLSLQKTNVTAHQSWASALMFISTRQWHRGEIFKQGALVIVLKSWFDDKSDNLLSENHHNFSLRGIIIGKTR